MPLLALQLRAVSRYRGVFLWFSWFLLIFTVIVTLAVTYGTVRADEQRYVYDPLGRLYQVLDTAGNTATYHYDAVGNLLSITRTAAQLPPVVTGITPTQARAGETVTATMTGLHLSEAVVSTTYPGVGLSGISATSTSITLTIILSPTVPVGEAILTVSTQGGSASVPFTVLPAPPAPILNPSLLAVEPGKTATLTVGIAQADPYNVRITLSVANPAIATVSPTTVTLLPGETSRTVTVEGIALGRTTLLALAGVKQTQAIIAVVTKPIWSITLVSVDANGVQGNDYCVVPAISDDGRYVAFFSWATNLVTGDTNWSSDIFVKNVQTRVLDRVSVDLNGVEGNSNSYYPVLSADGRYVAFESRAYNLVPDDTNRRWDVFVKDRLTGAIERASMDATGIQGDGGSYAPAISADGRFVAFESNASNLIPGGTSGTAQIFVKDRQTGVVKIASADANGLHGNGSSLNSAISADGRFVAFESIATNLVPEDTNGRSDIFVKDLQTGAIERVSAGAGGVQGDGVSYAPAISADGRFVAFESRASNLVPGDTGGLLHVYVKDRLTGAIELVSTDISGVPGDNLSGQAAINADGRYVAFASLAANLVAGGTTGVQHVYVRDRLTGTVDLLSVDNNGVEGDDISGRPAINGTGEFVAFASRATNLVPGDTNGYTDIFVVRKTNP